jgi:hypothetical protein
MSGILLGFATFLSHAQAAGSSYTQANGIRENATVTHVDRQPDSEDGGYVSTYLTVTLPTPVNGRTSTVVNLSYIDNQGNYTDGQVVAVLVNPRNPGYAELPGQPYAVGPQTVAIGLLAVLSLVCGVAMTIDGVRTSQRRNSRNAVNAAAGTSGASSGM